jgi:secreted trypsin-like serine protease
LSQFYNSNFNPATQAAINDIAILILKTRVRFNTDVRPACVYHSDTNQLDNPGEDGFEVAGWGVTETGRITDYLQWLAFTRIPPDTCQTAMRKNRPDFLVLESQICAEGDPELRADTCNGDSGGPMVTSIDSKWYLAGIVSFGTKACDSSTPSFYTRVASYYEWIEKKMITTNQPKGKYGFCRQKRGPRVGGGSMP